MIPVNLAKQSINPHPVEFGDDRMEKKQMADITTITIRDIFLDNLPENVTREEGEEFWNAWLDRQREGHEPDMPTPPLRAGWSGRLRLRGAVSGKRPADRRPEA